MERKHSTAVILDGRAAGVSASTSDTDRGLSIDRIRDPKGDRATARRRDRFMPHRRW